MPFAQPTLGLVEKVVAIAQRLLGVLIDRNGDRLNVLEAVPSKLRTVPGPKRWQALANFFPAEISGPGRGNRLASILGWAAFPVGLQLEHPQSFSH